ncbi:MAG: DNA replication and repair protein RecF [Candidatus Amulumruptor caecigallinarius]|nr:DNA replication and repair protein RecF [Candidatus Amulumruptor caecigallinarius]MCM1397074.1 DNA replication and repair protein RecF [Candidatus Amulumruptor caecigallinarius]MCM1454060.1 DNA replication and repair protein RecF [bacterium]
MQLDRLTVTDFKNIPAATLEFHPRLNGLLGRNGMGKSNLLDAIYTLSFTKSFAGVTDRELVRLGQPFFMLRGEYTRRGFPEELSLGYVTGKRKSLKRKGKEYGRLAEHIGAFPLVMVSPRDTDLVRGPGSERRRWIDMIISQGDAAYLDALMRYNNALEQRNRLLRDGHTDPTLMEVLELTMASAADVITAARQTNVARLAEIFSRRYASMAGEHEVVGLAYTSELLVPGVTLHDILNRERRHDMLVRHTTAGPHRDDIEMTLGCMNVRRTASEGQCKTFTIALRMAQYEFLAEATRLKPLLLLDDIFDKLDSERVSRIISLVTGPEFGQIFITDTNRKHLDELLGPAGGSMKLWEVEGGCFEPIKPE